MKFTKLEMLNNEEQQLIQRLEEIKAKREPLTLLVQECEGAIALIADLNIRAESIDHSLALDFRSEVIKALGLNLTLGGQEEFSVWQDKLSKSEEAIASKNLEVEKLIAALEQVEEERDRIAKELKAAQETINQLEDALDQDQVEEQMYEMYGSSDEITKDEIETGLKIGDKVKDTSRPDRGIGEVKQIRHGESFPVVVNFGESVLRYELELQESDLTPADEPIDDENAPVSETLVLEKNDIVQITDGRVCVVEYPAGELALLRHPDGTSANYRVANLKFISKGQAAIATEEEDNSDKKIKDLLDFSSAKQMMGRTWQDVQVACKQNSKLTFRNLLLEVSSAKGRIKKFGDRLPELYAQYLFETRDESDFEWLPEQFIEQAKALEEEKRKSTSNTQVQQINLVEEANDQVPFDCEWAGDAFDAAHGCKGEMLGRIFADYEIRWHREDGSSFKRREEPDNLTWVRPLKDSAA